MLYIRPVSVHLSREGRRLAKVKKRRPYDVAMALHNTIFSRCHNGLTPATKSDETIIDKDCTDAAAPSSPKAEADGEEDDDEEVGKTKKMGEGVQTVKTTKTVKILKNRIPLSTIVQKLMDRLPTGLILLTKTPALVANHHLSASSSPKVDSAHQQHVSPRKRILREFERVSLDDTTSQKRHRAKNSTNTVVVSSTRSVAAAAPTFQSNSGSNAPSASATVISKTVMPNGSGHEVAAAAVGAATTAAPPPEAEKVSTSGSVVSKPISSYSIISLLGHNNNSSKTNDKTPSHAKDEATVPPTSPCGGQDNIQSRLPPKKKSPPYGNNNWSPKPTSTARQSSPSSNVGSPSSHNYNLMRSPDLSPSPEQQHSLTRYKSHYTGLHYSGSSGTTGGASTGFHPYFQARGSPSPSSETFNSRYRSSGGYLSGSPQHNRANNNSPSSCYSPIPNTVTGSYPPHSPQHFASKAYSGYGSSVPAAYSNNKLRTSPCRSPSTADTQQSSHKKTVKQHRSPVASPNTNDGRRKQDGRKYSEEQDRLPEEDVRMAKEEFGSKVDHHIKREATPPDNERMGKLSSQELEYLAAISKANSHPLLSGIDMAFAAAMIRPPPYLMYPPTHGSPLHHTQAPPGVAAFLPNISPFYNPYPAAAAAAVYRQQQSWLNYPPIPSASRLPSASLLAYDAAASGLGPPAPSAASPSSTPWGPVPHNHALGTTDNSAALDRIKDDPGSG